MTETLYFQEDELISIYSAQGVDKEIEKIQQNYNLQLIQLKNAEMMGKCLQGLVKYRDLTKLKREKYEISVKFYSQNLLHNILLRWNEYFFSKFLQFKNRERGKTKYMNYYVKKSLQNWKNLIRYKKIYLKKCEHLEKLTLRIWLKIAKISKQFKKAYKFNRLKMLLKCVVGLKRNKNLNYDNYKSVLENKGKILKKQFFIYWHLSYKEKILLRSIHLKLIPYNKELLSEIFNKWVKYAIKCQSKRFNIFSNKKCIFCKVILNSCIKI